MFYRLAFFKAAYILFDAEFYVKADDDIYLRPGKTGRLYHVFMKIISHHEILILSIPDRLAILLAKDRAHRRTYIGCMKKGPVVTDPKMKW